MGGGFSGTMLAAQLAERGLNSTIIEKAGRAGLGTAYSTGDPAHLLNVRTGSMSAWPGRLDDFEAWLAARGEPGGGFAQRTLFGRYLSDILEAAVASGRVTVVDGEAIAAEREGGGWTVALADGRAIAGDAVALANGNQPPEPLNIRGLDRSLLIDDPWSDAGRARVEAVAASDAPVVIVGTGLTMVDMVLSLEAAGHGGIITAVSRRGLIPRGHAREPAAALDGGDAPRALMALWRWLRGRVAAGDDWRARVDSLRPLTAALWQGLSLDEKRRFMRHARPWWDVHRHRIAPEVAETLKRRIGEGRLEVIAGRIRGARMVGEGRAEIMIAKRRGEEVERPAALVVNCTGPLGRIAATRDPLLRQLLDSGHARPDALGIGFDCDERDALRGSDGLWVLGPPSKARRWEIIAVPDIRGQAEAMAEAMAGDNANRLGSKMLA